MKYCLFLLIVSLSACGGHLESPFIEAHQTKANEAYNPSNMITALDQILLWHQANQTGLTAQLNPGKEPAAIVEEFANLPCQPTEELIQLWAWHNGTKAASPPFIWYHKFLSIEEAITEYKWLRDNPLLGWQNNWIPIFEFEGEWYFVECFEETRLASPVGYFFVEETEAVYAYISLTKMLETSAEMFEQEAVFWDKENLGMYEDIKAVYEIQQRLNEGTQFPYYVE